MTSKISSCGIYVAPSRVPNAGYGVFANKNFKKGAIVEQAPFLEIETPYGNELMNYVFQSHLNRDKSIVVFGNGSIYNHSAQPNIVYSISSKLPSDRLFTYTALKDIKKGDELFINYGKDHPINEIIRRTKQNNKTRTKSRTKPTKLTKPKNTRRKAAKIVTVTTTNKTKNRSNIRQN